jgi:transposase-like protein
MKKPRRSFSEEVKSRAVDEYVSGRRRAADVANDLGIGQGLLYRWRLQLAEQAKGARVEELEAEGHHPEDARRIQSLEDELLIYKEKLAEAMVHNDLLKKLHGPLYPELKNANGLDEIKRILDRSKRRVK